MLAGKFKIKLDSAGRCTIPSKLRKGLGSDIIITASLGGSECLTVYSRDRWERLQQNLFPSSQPRNLREEVLQAMRYLGSNAEVAELDNNHRVVISAELRERVGLGQEGVMIGALDHAEIWPAERWEAYEQELMEVATQQRIQEVLTHPEGDLS